jgi:hypothetical protein
LMWEYILILTLLCHTFWVHMQILCIWQT